MLSAKLQPESQNFASLKNLLGIIFFAHLFFIVFAGEIIAGDVVINEFLVDPDSAQWVELYNKGSSHIDISGWVIDDSGGTQKFTIPVSTIINSLEYKVFESPYFNLNRTSSDIIQLINGFSVEDSYAYLSGPGVNNAFGRQKDGEGNWVVFTLPTKGSSNNDSLPAPTPTPTILSPSNTPTPTKVPIPTKTPTPTKSPTPTKVPTPTGTQTPTPYKTHSAISQFTTPGYNPTSPALNSSSLQDNAQSTHTARVAMNILGEKTTLGVDKKPAKTSDASKKSLSVALLVSGLIFISLCGILAIRNYRRRKNLLEL